MCEVTVVRHPRVPIFQKVTLTIEINSYEELYGLEDLSGLDVSIPDFVQSKVGSSKGAKAALRSILSQIYKELRTLKVE